MSSGMSSEMTDDSIMMSTLDSLDSIDTTVNLESHNSIVADMGPTKKAKTPQFRHHESCCHYQNQCQKYGTPVLLKPNQVYKLLYTNPVCLLTSLLSPSTTKPNNNTHPHSDFDRNPNVMTITWLTPTDNHGNFFCSINANRFSIKNVLQSKRFVLNVPVAGMQTMIGDIGRCSGSTWYNSPPQFPALPPPSNTHHQQQQQHRTSPLKKNTHMSSNNDPDHNNNNNVSDTTNNNTKSAPTQKQSNSNNNHNKDDEMMNPARFSKFQQLNIVTTSVGWKHFGPENMAIQPPQQLVSVPSGTMNNNDNIKTTNPNNQKNDLHIVPSGFNIIDDVDDINTHIENIIKRSYQGPKRIQSLPSTAKKQHNIGINTRSKKTITQPQDQSQDNQLLQSETINQAEYNRINQANQDLIYLKEELEKSLQFGDIVLTDCVAHIVCEVVGYVSPNDTTQSNSPSNFNDDDMNSIIHGDVGTPGHYSIFAKTKIGFVRRKYWNNGLFQPEDKVNDPPYLTFLGQGEFLSCTHL